MGTLGYALLGLLAREPMTGYDLTRRMDFPVGYVWVAHHSQIYPTLLGLEQEGLVRHRVIEGRGPRDTKRYTISARGRRALRDWVASPLKPPEARSEFMLRIRALWTVSPDVAIGLLRQARDQHRERLRLYDAEEQGFSHDDRTDVSRPGFSSYATLRCGISHERHMLAWCDWMLEQVST